MLSSHDEQFRQQAMELWKNNSSALNRHYICNGCGTELDAHGECCAEVIKYVRVGAYSQLIDVVKQYLPEILRIRNALRNGNEKSHNLTGSYLRRLWESESGNQLNLSLIASIDGVSLTGNTRQKVWPVTMLLVDLPTYEMQRAKNLVVHGIAEGRINPSTHFWNAVVPLVYMDVESGSTEVQGFEVKFGIASWVADQPAKRSLFGMKAPNSESSCFYGLCSGTFHKTKADDRSKARGDRLTYEDSRTARYGFGQLHPTILNYCYPYHTVLDLLHNASGGVYSIVLAESTTAGIDRKSSLFENDFRLCSSLMESVILPRQFVVKNITNCSERLLVFRINLGLSALVNESLKPEARIVIGSLMLLTNALYSNVEPGNDRFYHHLCEAARCGLESASIQYLPMKAHELVSHLPDVIEKFGNTATLSTFSFEHFYKYSLKGFSAQKTTNFIESAISRVLLHSGICREIQIRSKNVPSPVLHHFLSSTPSLKPFQPAWRNRIFSLHQNDQVTELSGFEFYSTLALSIGRLQSLYKAGSEGNQIFFASDCNGVHCCYRFIYVAVKGSDAWILAEKIRSICGDDHFKLLRIAAEGMPRPSNTAAYNLLNQFKRFRGIVHGKLSGEREVIGFDSVKGIGGYLPDGNLGYYLQLNGGWVHH
ncbi:unnamed protein product [Caenorhabditis nigoni]